MQEASNSQLQDPRFGLPPLVTVAQAASLGCGSKRKLRDLCEDGTLKAVRLGRSWRLNRDFLLKYFELV